MNEEVAVECMKAGADDYIIKENLSRLGPAILNSIKKIRLIKEKKIIEDELWKSDLRLQKAQSIAHVGNWELDLSKKTVWCSEEALRIYGFGFESHEIPFDTVQNCALVEYQPIMGDSLDRLLKYNEPYEIELKIRRLNDNAIRSIYSKAELIQEPDDEQVKVLGVIQDITDLKLAGETIMHERKLLRAMIDNIPDHIFVKDAKGRKIISNLSDYRDFGFVNEDQVLGKTDLEIFPGQIGVRGHADEMAVISSGIPVINREEDFTYPDGTKHWLLSTMIPLQSDDGEITGLVGIGRDITKRKWAEEALQHSYMFNESLLRTIPFGMQIVDGEGTLLFQNDKLLRIFGEDSVGKKCWELFCDNKKQCSECPLINGIKIGETDAYETKGVLGGRVFEINHTGMMYQGKEAMLEIFHDITDRKENEEELIRAKEKAEESDKFKTAFIHNVSHEIRTPMNAIVGFSTLLVDDELDSKTRQSYIDVIMQSSNHLLAIITDIVDISNIEARQVKIFKGEININAKLKSLCDQFKPKVEEKNMTLTLETTLGYADAFIITDSTKLFQILTNLVANAIKFTQSGEIKIKYRVVENFLEFSVKDTGIGISKEYHEKIFDRFFQVQNTVSRVYEGTGLGLSISKAYVNLLGGKIWLESEPGLGTTFFFTLPFEKSDIKKETISDMNLPGINKSAAKKTILIAEDIDSNFKLLKYFLTGTNIEILRAVNGKEAVDKCLTDTSIDLILMDIKMPVMDGYTAVRLIRERNSTVPIIAQTAYADDKDKAIEAGCSGFISKPFDKKGLLRVLSDYI